MRGLTVDKLLRVQNALSLQKPGDVGHVVSVEVFTMILCTEYN